MLAEEKEEQDQEQGVKMQAPNILRKRVSKFLDKNKGQLKAVI
jgi:hypothetical protein